MSEAIRAQIEAEGLIIHMGLDPQQIRSDELTGHVFRTALTSVLEFGPGTVAPTVRDSDNPVAFQIEPQRQDGTLVTRSKPRPNKIPGAVLPPGRRASLQASLDNVDAARHAATGEWNKWPS